MRSQSGTTIPPGSAAVGMKGVDPAAPMAPATGLPSWRQRAPNRRRCGSCWGDDFISSACSTVARNGSAVCAA